MLHIYYPNTNLLQKPNLSFVVFDKSSKHSCKSCRSFHAKAINFEISQIYYGAPLLLQWKRHVMVNFPWIHGHRWHQWVPGSPQRKGFDMRGWFSGIVAAWLPLAAWSTPLLTSRLWPSQSSWAMAMAATRIVIISISTKLKARPLTPIREINKWTPRQMKLLF